MFKTQYLIIWYAACLHILWGICLLLDSSVVGVTGIGLLYKVFPDPWLLAFVCIFVGAISIFGVLHSHSKLQFFFLAPQQFFLFLSAVSSIHCVWYSTYADGIVHPRYFILADQSPSLIVLFFYSWSVFWIYRDVAEKSVDSGTSGTNTF